jgi:hypothetical protein
MRYLALASVVACTLSAFAADKTDVVEFGSGSRLVGEFKRVERGKLYFKTDATDTIAIDWRDVTKLESSQTVRVQRNDGALHFGKLLPAESHTLAVGSTSSNQRIAMLDAVSLQPIEEEVWDRFDVDTSVGYAFTKATEVEQFNFSAKIEYETEQRNRTLELSSQSSRSDEEERSTRNVASYETTRLHRDRWFSGWVAGYEANDALGLEYRFTGAGIYGREFFPSPDARVRTFGGVGVNEERFENDDSQQSLEGVLGAQLDWFRFSHPELDLTTTLAVIPSITELGRVRVGFDTTLEWEIYDDLYWRLTFFDDFDTDARSDDAESDQAENDYGITTSIGWTW